MKWIKEKDGLYTSSYWSCERFEGKRHSMWRLSHGLGDEFREFPVKKEAFDWAKKLEEEGVTYTGGDILIDRDSLLRIFNEVKYVYSLCLSPDELKKSLPMINKAIYKTQKCRPFGSEESA